MANAVVAEAKRHGLTHEEYHSQVQYVVAHGISSMVEGKKVIIGSAHFVFEDEGCRIPEGEQPKFDALPAAYSHLYLCIDGELAAVICIHDPLRREAREAVRALHESGFANVVMMTGDNRRTAEAVAAEVGVDAVYAEVLPEDKAAFIRQEKAKGHTVIMVGETLTVEQLLYCMLVISANETCNILGEAVSGSVDAFVEKMNQRAQELGCQNTHFANTTGLTQSGHYSSAWDIYLITREAMKHDDFMTIVNTKAYTVPATNMTEKERELHSTNALISNWRMTGYLYSGAQGIKTGTTDAAGHCLVSSAIRGSRTLISVVLGAKYEKNLTAQVFHRQKSAFQMNLQKKSFPHLLQTMRQSTAGALELTW